MKRLEFHRVVRGRTFQARNAAEAVMFLANYARERYRLQQERVSLAKRIERIELRLTEIAGSETKLAPMAQLTPGAALPPMTMNRDAMLQY